MLLMGSAPAAAAEVVDTVEWGGILVGLLGGLALFLFGMGQMTDSLKAVAGQGLRLLLAKLTRNRFTAALTGAFVTAVIQSSSVTTVLVVGFISAGLLSLQQSVGVIMGANVGTTLTAQIIAFKVTQYALVLIAGGFFISFVARRDRVRRTGELVMGLGLVFYGMQLMSDGTAPLREYEPFIDLMGRMDSAWLGILVGAGFTALVQSSSATTGIVIVLASQGFLSLEAGIAIALGSNIGTCATAILSALGKPREALQAAMVHVLFNVIGALMWVFLIDQLAELVRSLSPQATGLEGTALLAAETPRQIANAHTVFNVANTAVLIWFTKPIARLVERLVPIRPEPEPEAVEARYLDEGFLETPALALDRIRLEVARLGDKACHIVHLAGGDPDAPDAGGLPRAGELSSEVERVRELHRLILAYARRLLAQDLTELEGERLQGLLTAASDLDTLAESVVQDLTVIGEEWESRELESSEETRRRIRELYRVVEDALQQAADSLRDADMERARAVVEDKGRVVELVDGLQLRLGERLSAEGEKRLDVYRAEMRVVELLRNLHKFARRVAKVAVREAVRTPGGSKEKGGG
jgi:phosphate:Na+ symporter